MKFHVLSLCLGFVIGVAVIFVAFFAFGSELNNFFSNSSTNTQTVENVKPQMSLFTDNASPFLGSSDASITMIEFGDYQCFYCNKFFHSTEPDIVKNYIDTGKVKLVFKDLTIIGQDSVNAANAAHCAQEKGKFWQYHDLLYNNWAGENTGWAAPSNLLAFAKQVGINATDFNACMSDARYLSVIKGSLSDAQTLGLSGTPDFFIIGPDGSVSKVIGAQPYEIFDEIFKAKLKV